MREIKLTIEQLHEFLLVTWSTPNSRVPYNADYWRWYKLAGII